MKSKKSSIVWTKMNNDSVFIILKSFVFLILILLMPSISKSSKSITLDEAVHQAIEKNDGIKSSKLKSEVREQGVNDAFSKLYPELSFDFFYTHMDKDLVLDLNPIRSAIIQLQTNDAVNMSNLQNIITKGKPLTDPEKSVISSVAAQKLEAGIPDFQEIVKEQNFPQAVFSLKQPIFTGGKILAGIRAAEAQSEIEKSRFKSDKENLIGQVIENYLNVILAEENYKVRLELSMTVNKHADRARRMMDEGVIPSNDKLRADVAKSEAERNLFEADQKRKIAKLALLSIIKSDEEIIIFSDSLIFREIDKASSSFILDTKNKNVNIETLRSSEKALHEKVNANFADYFPKVFGFGFYNCFDHYIIPKTEPKWAIGIGAHLTIFDGMKRTNDYQMSKKDEESIKYLIKDLDRKLELLSRNQFMEMQLAKNTYFQLDAAILQANENLRLNEKRFETGLGTSLEVLDANMILESIKLKRAKALTDYYMNMAALYRTSGSIEEFIIFWSHK